jgi:hemerythrin-like domain-containing protein
MNPIDILKKEHKQIEMELVQFEAVMEEPIVNYANLIHTFKNFCPLWNNHEKKEEGIFLVMKKEKIKIPVYTMTCEHRDLRKHIAKIVEAINSGSEIKVKECLDNDLKDLIRKIRKHKDDEDEILYTLALEEFTKEELEEMRKLIEEFL